MPAASALLICALAVAPGAGPPAPVEAQKTLIRNEQLQYLVKLRVFRGAMPNDPADSSGLIAEPTLIVEAGREAELFAGGEAAESDEQSRFGISVEAEVTGSHRNLRSLDLAVRHRERLSDGTLPEWSTARFAGPIPLDETFRFSGDGIWAAVEVEYVGPSLKAWEDRYPEPVGYEIPVRLYEGELLADGTDAGKLLGRPVIRTLAGSPASIMSGHEGPARRADGAPASMGRYRQLDVTAVPAGADAVRVVATLRVASLVETSFEEFSRRKPFPEDAAGEPDARFVGVVRLGEPFRLGGGGVWAEMAVKRLDACE